MSLWAEVIHNRIHKCSPFISFLRLWAIRYIYHPNVRVPKETRPLTSLGQGRASCIWPLRVGEWHSRKQRRAFEMGNFERFVNDSEGRFDSMSQRVAREGL